jgi:hypothetical protein
VGINNLLMVLAIYLYAASGAKSALARKMRHPQLIAVKTWALAHLLVNGDLPSLILFGGLLAWAVVSVILINRAQRDWTPPVAKPASAPEPPSSNLDTATTQRLADRYLTDKNWVISEKLIDYAEARGHTALELAFSWLLAQAPVSSVIAGATKPEQLEQNVTAGGWKLSAEELAEIDRITAG